MAISSNERKISGEPVLLFKKWMAKSKIGMLGCDFGVSSEFAAVRGVCAIRDIPVGEVLVSVPDAAVIMPHTCSIQDSLESAELCNSSGNAQHESLGLVIAVMAEKCLGVHSSWFEYLNFLPNEVSGMPMYWTKKELQPLRNTSLADKLDGKWGMPGCHVEPPTQVEEHYKSVVLPFMERNDVSGFPQDPKRRYQLYLWATALVSGYSFSLGEDQFQAMVPLWDMLNHVTGQCNVRLHHSAKRGALQMISVKSIRKGQEIINNYGPLSDSELLRRFGFIDTEPNPYNGCEIPCAMLMARCRQHLQPAPLQQLPNDTAQAPPASEDLMQRKTRFLQNHGLFPSDGWFKVDVDGQPQYEMVEFVRVLLLPSADFKAFQKQVDNWHCPLTRPLAQLTSISHQVSHVIQQLATERLAGLAELSPVREGVQQSFRQTAAQAVLRTERQTLLALQLWLDSHDELSLVDSIRKVWTHIR